MTGKRSKHTAEYLRHRAAESRAKAQAMPVDDDRTVLTEVADMFDRLAMKAGGRGGSGYSPAGMAPAGHTKKRPRC